MEDESIINFGNQPDLIGTSGVWHRWGPRLGWFQLISGWCLTFELSNKEDWLFFFVVGDLPQRRTEVCFFWSCMTRPYKKNMSDAAMQQHPWSLIEIRGYESIEACSFCSGMMDMDYWQIWTCQPNFMSFHIFITNMATNYVILYWYALYLPFLCFKQQPIHTICFKNTLLVTEYCRSCQHHLGSQGFEICTSFYAGSSRALDYSNMVEEMYWCSGSDVVLSVFLVGEGWHSSIFSGTIHYSNRIWDIYDFLKDGYTAVAAD